MPAHNSIFDAYESMGHEWVMGHKSDPWSTLVPSDAPTQGASFYVERIDLASKLSELNQKWRWSRSFSGKSPPLIFRHCTRRNIFAFKIIYNIRVFQYTPRWLLRNLN